MERPEQDLIGIEIELEMLGFHLKLRANSDDQLDCLDPWVLNVFCLLISL